MALCAAFTLNIFVCPHIFRAVVYLYLSLSLSPQLSRSIFLHKAAGQGFGRGADDAGMDVKEGLLSGRGPFFLVLKP